MKVPIKQILLEGIIEDLIKTIKSKFTFFSSKFKYLTKEEFETLLNVLYGWYYLNHKFPDNLESKHPEVIKLFNKIKTNSNTKLPNTLYRGLAFSNKKDMDQFIKEIKDTGKVNGKLFRLKQDTRYTAWSSSKKIATSFLPGGENSHHDNYGCLITINTKDLKMDNFTFSIKLLLSNESEIKDFLQLILKMELDKNLKYINDTKSKKLDPRRMFGYQHGSVFSLIEDEYILNNVPFSICKVEVTK